MRDRTAKYLSSLHRVLYRTTRGIVGRRLVNNDMCLLSTTGRRSGKTHTVPLLYLHGGARLVVIASWGGRDQHPDWYKNLVAIPHATVQVLGDRWEVGAMTANSAERDLWWPKIVEGYGGYADYTSRTERDIPVVFLDPSDAAAT
jgi:deazaflavin-dependent oxidoreductase (nitroreductase family)